MPIPRRRATRRAVGGAIGLVSRIIKIDCSLNLDVGLDRQ